MQMDIVFKGLHTDVPERFRAHATGKLAKIEKLDHKAIRVDVEVTVERNPRQSDRKERVELTITTRGPAIRAEAAAEDRFSALDLALAKLESRLRRACDRRKDRYAASAPLLPGEVQPARPADAGTDVADTGLAGTGLADTGLAAASTVPLSRPAPDAAGPGWAGPDLAGTDLAGTDLADTGPADTEKTVAIEMQGDGPLVVREKTHVAGPMTIDQALFEMELIGHDFFLFNDTAAGVPSVVYRRRGYQYGVIRLVAQGAAAAAAAGAGAGVGRSRRAANLGAG
jgi:ribosomal subunit interface protein